LVPSGVDAVFDARGGMHLWESRRLAARRGQIIAYGIATALRDGRKNLVSVGALLWFLGLTKILPGPRGSLYAIDRVVKHDRGSVIGDPMFLFDFVRARRIKPLITGRLSFADAPRAHSLLESKGTVGKLVFVL